MIVLCEVVRVYDTMHNTTILPPMLRAVLYEAFFPFFPFFRFFSFSFFSVFHKMEIAIDSEPKIGGKLRGCCTGCCPHTFRTI